MTVRTAMVVLLCGLAQAVGAAPAGEPLHTIGEVRRLSSEEAAQGRTVRVRAVVTYYHHDWEMLFVQDATGGIYVYLDRRKPAWPITVGQVVEIEAKTVPGDFIPSLTAPAIKPLEPSGLPEATPATIKGLAAGSQDANWIEVRGIVRSVALVDDILDLDLMMEGGRIKVHIQEWSQGSDLSQLVDAEVRVRGVCATATNERRQFVSAELWTPHEREITVEARAPEPFTLPLRSMDGLRRYTFAGGHDRRLRVEGVVTLPQPGRGVFIQQGEDGLFVQSGQKIALQPGDRVQAVGFLAPGEGRPRLEHGLLRREASGPPPTPVEATVEQAQHEDFDGRLVRLKARLVGRVFAAGEEQLVLQEGAAVFNARVGGGSFGESAARLRQESLLQVTGVASLTPGEAGQHGLQVFLRGPADLLVLQQPSWWTASRIRWSLGALVGIACLALAWVGLLRARVRAQTVVIRERLEREAALERRYSDLVENANDLVFSLDDAGRFTEVNAAVERILGYSRQEILGRSLSSLEAQRSRGGEEPVRFGPAGPEVEMKTSSGSQELEMIARDGATVVLEVSARPRVGDGSAAGVEAIARDVTERKRAERELRHKEEALRESQERFALAVQGTNDGIWDWDLRTGRVYYSPRWKAMLGYVEAEIAPTTEEWFRLVHSEDLEGLRAKLALHRDGLTQHFEHEHRMRHKDGSYRWVLSRGFALRDEDGRAYRMAGAQTDVTDRRFYDPLTHLPNRALFAERLEKGVLRTRHNPDHQFAVLFLDLDRFKNVNDSLGHLEGDCLLVSMAERFYTCVRPGDMIARFGGDEFAILIDSISGVSDAAHVAERIRKALLAPFKLGPHEVYISASMGLALSSSGYERAEDLLRDADTAMYRAKATGSGRVEIFDEAMRAAVTALLQTENDLRRALARSELRVVYQPIVALATENLVGWEALVRWQHPEHGLLEPKDFMKVAEETGLVVPIGDAVLGEACRQMKSWQDRHPGLAKQWICVNISARQFGDPELVERVLRSLRQASLAPASLVLEITESAIMQTAEAAAVMGQLQALGVRLHIDDFGTGYSSLVHLRKFPVDALKIDRSFVESMSSCDEARAIVESIVGLARSLGLAVIAEGVQTDEQAGALRTLGCEMAQGLCYSLALESPEADALAAGAARESGLPATVPWKETRE